MLIRRKEKKMPFTPFHMGAALIVKPGLGRNISVITFGIAQIAMDIEPGIGMLTGAEVLHGPTHTILGALAIACVVMLIAPGIVNYLLRKWNKEVTFHKLPWLVQSEITSKIAVTMGAFFGTLSHIALDSLMHHDFTLSFRFHERIHCWASSPTTRCINCAQLQVPWGRSLG
jgi:hypothetical protein